MNRRGFLGLLLALLFGRRLLAPRPRAPRLPPGLMINWVGEKSPPGFLACNGQAVSRSAYTGLFEAIGTIYGPGDGRSTFNLPNLSSYYYLKT